MYLSKKTTTRLRALLLVGLITIAPAASAISNEGSRTFSEWLQQLLSSIFITSVTEDEEQCPCGGTNPDCNGIHLPGG